MAIGVFLVPLILVKITAVMMAQPQGASASTGTIAVPPDIPSLTAYSPDWDEDQLAAVRRVQELREMAFGPSPLLHIVERIATTEAQRPTIVVPPAVSVQAILRSSRGNIARIGRKLFREGDELGDTGWTVKTIDANNRSVVIVHVATEAEATLTVPLP